MTPDDIISRVEGTKIDIEALKRALRKAYPKSGAQITNKDIKAEVKRISEDWVTQLAGEQVVVDAIEEDSRANLSVAFQRLYNAADRSAKRSTYDGIIKDINEALSPTKILAIKTVARKPHPIATLLTRAETPLIVADKLSTAFVGHSFLPKDLAVAQGVIDTLAAVGVIAVTGEKPKAERISEKVKDLIDSQEIFVGVFPRRDRLQGRNKFTTTTWVLEEKAYAIAKNKRLILLREEGVETIGGLHGDHEYIEFSRSDVAAMLVKMLRMFNIRTTGLR